MTFQVRKSLLASTDLFDIEVAAFAKEVRDWLEREAKVKEEEGRTDIAPIDRHHRYRAPSAHPLIVDAVDPETGLPNYEYIDDPIKERQAKLAEQVSAAASEAINRLMSPAKLRAAQLRLSDIARDDAARTEQVLAEHSGLLQKLKIKSIDQEAVAAGVAALRTDDDNILLAEMHETRKSIEIIHRKVIEAHSAIEDLTPETVDAWKMPEF